MDTNDERRSGPSNEERLGSLYAPGDYRETFDRGTEARALRAEIAHDRASVREDEIAMRAIGLTLEDTAAEIFGLGCVSFGTAPLTQYPQR
jgi:hypothetical protein